MADKHVLVTGGGSGIGEGIVHVLAGRGWHVVVNDVDADKAAAVAKAVGGIALPGDVDKDAERLIAESVKQCGALHGLVNNAGIIMRSMLESVPDEHLDRVFSVNLRATVRLSRFALPHLESTGGSIVNISSIAAEIAQVGGGLYSASKAGVSAFTRQAAAEWGPKGVRVNAVAPGLIRTAMAEAVYSVPETYEKRRAMIPLKKIGRPENIGTVVAFLLSDDAEYVSGQIIEVDGGFSHTLIGLLPHPRSD
ncbi:MAG: SDR family NAD(P)-dependent oxidoreductase [Ilumatobacteraceae bacterium]